MESKSFIASLPVKFNEEEIQDSPEVISMLNKVSESFKDKENEVKSLIKDVKQQHMWYCQNQVLLKAIKNIAYSSTYSQSVPVEKMKKVILAKDLSNCMNLNEDVETKKEYSDPRRESLFGLPCLSLTDNTFSSLEYSNIKLALEETLAESALKITRQSISVGKTDSSEIFPSTSYKEKFELLALKAQLDALLKEYNETLIKYRHISNELFKIRVIYLKDVIPKKLKHLSAKIELLLLKTEVNRLQILVDFYTEEENTIVGLNTINNILENETEPLSDELIMLRGKTVAYEKLHGTQFDKVLENYVNVIESIQQKSWLLEELNK